MNEQAPLAGTAGDTREQESEVLIDAARSLEELAQRLPASSKWSDVLVGVAEGFEAGAELSRMRDRHAA